MPAALTAQEIRRALTERNGTGMWAAAAASAGQRPAGVPDPPPGHVAGFYDSDRMGWGPEMDAGRRDDGRLVVALFDQHDDGCVIGEFAITFHTFNIPDLLSASPLRQTTPRLELWPAAVGPARHYLPHVLTLMEELADEDDVTVADLTRRLVAVGLTDLSRQPRT